ncbi:MAG: phosphocarrier protein HPr [Alphaproteobacteria bacterium]|jgi:phosphocarrier protein|nr:phosphocarrier protein HPr [Alphaproteobacteria bacterium]
MSDPASADGNGSPDRSHRDAALVRVLEIVNKKGLHARAAAKFVQTVEKFDAQVQVVKDGEAVDGASILDLLMLAAGPGTSIRIETAGKQAAEAMDALETLITTGFGEED